MITGTRITCRMILEKLAGERLSFAPRLTRHFRRPRMTNSFLEIALKKYITKHLMKIRPRPLR